VSVPVAITSPGSNAGAHDWAASTRARKPSASSGLPRALQPAPLGDKVVTAAERDFERLETPGYVLGVFRLCVPGTR
jgi:hypothetical protein